MNLTTQTDEAMAQGKDFEEIVIRKAEEVELLKKHGLYVEPDNGEGNSPTQDMAEVRMMLQDFMDNQIDMSRNG